VTELQNYPGPLSVTETVLKAFGR